MNEFKANKENKEVQKCVTAAERLSGALTIQNNELRQLLEAAQKREQVSQEMQSRFNTQESIANQAKKTYNEIIRGDCRSQIYIDLKHKFDESVRNMYSFIKECTPYINNNKRIRDLTSGAKKLCRDLEKQAKELIKKANEQQRKAQELARKQELAKQNERRRRSSQARRNSNPPPSRPSPPTRPADRRRHSAPQAPYPISSSGSI